MKRPYRLAGLVLACLFLIVFAPSASAQVRDTNMWWLPEVVTKGGEKIDFIFYMIFWLTFAVFLLTQSVFLWFIVKYRRKRGVPAVYSHGNNKLEIIWTTAPALIFIVLGIYSNHIWNTELRAPAPEDSIRIDIVAYQFGWHIRNPGQDGKLGAYDVKLQSKDNWFGLKDKEGDADGIDDYQSENVLTVPVGRNVNIILSSLDVIHSFYVPVFRMYQDAVPGRSINWVWFEATKTGTFDLACSQLCGSGHFNMKATVNIVSQADYDKLVAEKSKAASLQQMKKNAAALPPLAADAPAAAVAVAGK
jgi:cytochrome c oxidase subunit II